MGIAVDKRHERDWYCQPKALGHVALGSYHILAAPVHLGLDGFCKEVGIPNTMQKRAPRVQ